MITIILRHFMELLAYIDKIKQQKVRYINKSILLAYTANFSSRRSCSTILKLCTLPWFRSYKIISQKNLKYKIKTFTMCSESLFISGERKYLPFLKVPSVFSEQNHRMVKQKRNLSMHTSGGFCGFPQPNHVDFPSVHPELKIKTYKDFAVYSVVSALMGL